MTLIHAPKKAGKPNKKARIRLSETPPITFTVTGLSHDGRAVSSYGANGESDHPTEQNWAKKSLSAMPYPMRRSVYS